MDVDGALNGRLRSAGTTAHAPTALPQESVVWAAREVARIVADPQRMGGATFSLRDGDQYGRRAYAVSVVDANPRGAGDFCCGAALREAVEGYILRYERLLRQARCCVGIWTAPGEGITAGRLFIEVAAVIEVREAAERATLEWDQEGMYDLFRGEFVGADQIVGQLVRRPEISRQEMRVLPPEEQIRVAARRLEALAVWEAQVGTNKRARMDAIPAVVPGECYDGTAPNRGSARGKESRANRGQAAGLRLAVRVSEAAQMLDIGRSKAYDLIRTGEIPSIRVGKTMRVPVDALEAWVRQQARLADASTPQKQQKEVT